MTFWAAGVIIVMIWAIVQIYTRRHDRELGVTRDEDGNPVFAPVDREETRREIEELRERVKVLERIATDSHSLSSQQSRQIAADIEALRNERDD